MSRIQMAFAFGRFTVLSMLLLVSALFAPKAHAFTPESGMWWNPAEGGRGFAFEIQDNYLFFTGYLYNPDGTQLWYTTQGTMRGNAAYDGVLTGYRGGQCIGCTPRRPTTLLGVGGNISITFSTETTGRLTWSGGTIPIERFDFYYTRTTGDQRNDVMRGEWHATLDYSAVAGSTTNFFGDVLIFDRVDTTQNPRQTTGCRAPTSQAGRCVSSSRTASGFFDAPAGKHFFVVDNGFAGGVDTFAVYSVTLGYHQFDGSAKVCRKTISLSSCLSDTRVASTPVRGFRSASFAFVTTGSGPNSVDPSPKLSQTVVGLPLANATATSVNSFGAFPAEALDRLAASMR
jgi:hypothetical protein